MSEVEKRPRLVADGYGRYRSQWVKRPGVGSSGFEKVMIPIALF